jgi:hypothetical protein
MNILDLNDDQLQAIVDHGMGLEHLPPAVRDLTENLIELALRLREIKGLAIQHATAGTKVPADDIIRLLDGTRRIRR